MWWFATHKQLVLRFQHHEHSLQSANLLLQSKFKSASFKLSKKQLEVKQTFHSVLVSRYLQRGKKKFHAKNHYFDLQKLTEWKITPSIYIPFSSNVGQLYAQLLLKRNHACVNVPMKLSWVSEYPTVSEKMIIDQIFFQICFQNAPAMRYHVQ